MGMASPISSLQTWNRITVGVLLGNGDGTFQKFVVYGHGRETALMVPIRSPLADVNGDGKPDNRWQPTLDSVGVSVSVGQRRWIIPACP